ncbi:MAG: T9SS type A sorting domain-containing protein [Chitinophagales bacterium]|nr:T9SS type A sorting domain-containing protein [Chitinophagales bacterium]
MKLPFILFAILLSFFSKADIWIQRTNFPGVPTGGAVGFSINGKGYIGTGCCYEKGFWEYDPTTDAWAQKADIGGVGRVYAAGFSIGNKGYIGTGQITSNAFTDDLWEYDPDTNSWIQKASVPGGKRSEAFSFSIGSKGYIGGGASSLNAKEDFYEYDPSSDIWTHKADFGGGKRAAAAGFTISGKAYIGTGVDNQLLHRKDFWEYDPSVNIWSQKADFAGSKRIFDIGFNINGLGYMGLGYTWDTTAKYFHDIFEYDPSTNNWIEKTIYPGDAGDGASTFSINDVVYVGTGGTSGKQLWEFDPDSIATNVEVELVKPRSLTVYPNPVITSSNILFNLQQNSNVTIDLLDLSGRKIKSLCNQNFETGDHQVELKRDQLPSGIYFLKIKMNSQSSIIKIIIQ